MSAPPPTINLYGGEWDEVLRAKKARRVARCPKCTHPLLLLGESAHSPHFVVQSGLLVLVDCVGDEVSR